MPEAQCQNYCACGGTCGSSLHPSGCLEHIWKSLHPKQHTLAPTALVLTHFEAQMSYTNQQEAYQKRHRQSSFQQRRTYHVSKHKQTNKHTYA